jgi:hypothetical protein
MFRISLAIAALIFMIATVACLFKFNLFVGLASILYIIGNFITGLYFDLEDEE